MASSSSLDTMGWNRPSTSALYRRAASTSKITSAGEAAPSVFRRARMPASSASTRLILMPVALVKPLYRASSVAEWRGGGGGGRGGLRVLVMGCMFRGCEGVVREVMMSKRESFAGDIVVSVWRKKSPVVKPGLERILETGGFARIRGDNGRLRTWFAAQGGVTGPCTPQAALP